MKTNITTVLTISTLIFSSQGIASDPLTLDDLFAKPDPVKELEALKASESDSMKSLCEAILAKDFYDKAAAKGVGNIKRARMVSICQDYQPKVASTLAPEQKAKPAATAREVVKLKHVELKKGGTVQEEQAALEQAREVIMQNAAALGRQEEVAERVRVAQEQLKEAREAYDNLGAVIAVMREDMKELEGFKVFNPKAHDNDTPEEYLNALNAALPKEAEYVLVPQAREQLDAADRLLKQANENLANARKDLEALNREMLELNK